MDNEEKEERIKDLMEQHQRSMAQQSRKLNSVQEERDKKLNEITKKGIENKKEHDMAFQLLEVQAVRTAKASELDEKYFYEEEVEEFKKELLKEREAIIKKYEDKDKIIAAEYMEVLTKSNRGIKKLYNKMKAKSDQIVEKINLIAGTHLHVVMNPLSCKVKNWRKLMNTKGGEKK